MRPGDRHDGQLVHRGRCAAATPGAGRGAPAALRFSRRRGTWRWRTRTATSTVADDPTPFPGNDRRDDSRRPRGTAGSPRRSSATGPSTYAPHASRPLNRSASSFGGAVASAAASTAIRRPSLTATTRSSSWHCAATSVAASSGSSRTSPPVPRSRRARRGVRRPRDRDRPLGSEVGARAHAAAELLRVLVHRAGAPSRRGHGCGGHR